MFSQADVTDVGRKDILRLTFLSDVPEDITLPSMLFTDPEITKGALECSFLAKAFVLAPG